MKTCPSSELALVLALASVRGGVNDSPAFAPAQKTCTAICIMSFIIYMQHLAV